MGVAIDDDGRLAVLAGLSRAVVSCRTRDSLLEAAARSLGELVPYERCRVFLQDEEQTGVMELVERALLFPDRAVPVALEGAERARLGEGRVGRVAARRESELVELEETGEEAARGRLLMPLSFRERCLGVLELERRSEPAFSRDEVGMVEPVADLLAAALTNQRLLQQQENRESLRLLEEHSQVGSPTRDPLTGLLTRQRFEIELLRHLERAQRLQRPAALLWLDIDHFKDVNDSIGHREGDELLRQVGRCVAAQLRMRDIVARWGDDDFTILLADCGREQAETVAARLVDEVKRVSVVLAGRPVRVTASVGVALLPEHGVTAHEILAHADMALNVAKERGRNRWRVFAPEERLRDELENRLQWAPRLREAIDGGQFVLYSQPILDLHSCEVSQHEILLRLREPDGKLLAPGMFLGVAERLGLINEIDRWVLRKTIELIAEEAQRGRRLCFEVNLSGQAFSDQALLPMIEESLVETTIDPGALVLEITETAAVADLHRAQSFIETLKELGCRFAIDDFGVGFSSFHYLKHLPIDYLKIDGSFVKNLEKNEVDRHLVKSMVEMARGLGKLTIAEFVHSERCLELIRDYGVDFAQGYHVGRPGPVREMISQPVSSVLG